MGGGSSKTDAVKYEAVETVAILGVQGAGKSTVMKQFRDSGEGELDLRPSKALGIKYDILKSVALRTRVMMEYLCENSDMDSSMAIADELDALHDAESDFLSCYDEFQEMRVQGKNHVEEEAKSVVAEEAVRHNSVALLKTRQRQKQKSFCPKHQLDGHADEATKLAHLIKRLWEVKELTSVNKDEKVLFEICESLQSAEKEMLFISGGNFVGEEHNVATIMKEEYKLTRYDYCHTRTWTKDFNEAKMKLDDRTLTLRDVGGDEVNRQQHWANAIRDSFCTIFVVNLADFSKANKFQQTRHILWTYLIDEERPKIIMLLNKKDLFHKKLQIVGLHTCNEFADVPPKSEDESHDEYAKRCEDVVVAYFSTMPRPLQHTSLYRERLKDASFDPAAVKLNDTYVTQATDGSMFNGIKQELYGVFAEVLKGMLTDAF